MKRVFALAVAGALVAITAGCAETIKDHSAMAPKSASAFVGLDPYAQVAEMGRGVNVLSEDPGWSDPALARFKPEHFKKIYDAGFRTVRVVLYSFDRMDQYYQLDAGWLRRLDTMVDAALAAGLTVILDEHDYLICAKDAGTCGQKLNAFWAQVAPRYKDKSNKLVFEMLNEPHDALTPELWNAQIKQTLPIMRASNPLRNVIVGPAMYNSIPLLTKLELPVIDRHIITTVHYYMPIDFTHQGAPWTPQIKYTGRNWGSDADLAQLNKDFDTAKAWSVEWNRPILVGEFGAFEAAPMDGRVRYTAAVARAAEARGFAWSYWQFDKDFIVYDFAKDAWVEPILKALVPDGGASK
jgi:endoglucanase